MSDESPTCKIPPQDLLGKVAVVTGASRGIGRAIAVKLASRGCHLLGTCSNPDSIRLIEELGDSPTHQSSGGHEILVRCAGITADILLPSCATTIADALESKFKTVDGSREGCRGVDILVLNAAITGSVGIGDKESSEKAQEISPFLMGNIQAPVLIVDELVRRKLFRESSRIVLISSIRSREATPTSAMYSATKAAGESLVRTWAEAFGGKQQKFAFMTGTTANAVQVGLTKTTTMSLADPAAAEKYIAQYVPQQSIPRVAQPDDVAEIVSFLCSDQARWVTGSVISASGGGVKIG